MNPRGRPQSLLALAAPSAAVAVVPHGRLVLRSPSPALAAIFATWGVHTLGDLTDLPRDELVRRFGAEGLALWQRASGGEPRPHTGIDGGKFNLGETEAEPSGYLAMCQDPAGAIHLISSRNYYRFNLPWIQQRTTVPR